MGIIRVRIDDPEIARVALFAPLPLLLRLDVLPFLFLYVTATYLHMTRPEGDVIATLLTVATLFTNALTFLLGEWSTTMRAWLGHVTLRRLDATTSIVAKVEPARALLPAQLCPCSLIAGPPSSEELHHEKRDVPLLCFSYQNLTFCLFDDRKALQSGHGSFRRLDFPTQLPLREYTQARGFHSPASVARAQLKWGKNDFEIPVQSFRLLLKEQLVAPFFVFQFFCVLLWCLDEYVYYSLMTLALLVVFECTVVLQRQRNMATLNSMRRAPQPLFVYRNKRWSELWSDQLVPGDICSIGQKLPGVVRRQNDDKHTVVPCDFLLLRGECVANESMLTGESVPLRKEAIAHGDAEPDELLAIEDGTSQRHKKHVLFSGTKILQHSIPSDRYKGIPAPPDKGCVVYVLRTGFGTTQGSLMRTILHSSQRVTANNAEAMCFILLLLVFALVASGYVLQHGLQDPSRNRFKLFLHCVMIITSVVPPELPMELSLAVTNSLLALIKLHIFCTEPFRIPFAGRVDVCCFDKTGTLTSDELKFHGIAGLGTTLKGESPERHDGHFDLVAPTQLPIDTELVLAGCQSLVFLHGQVLGDPLEVMSLQSIKWTLAFGVANTVEPSVFSVHRGVIQNVMVLHRFAFSSELKRMTTVVSIAKGDNDEDDELRVLTKGAPEVLEPLFAQKPADYSKVYRHFAARGCRVIALGYRRLPSSASFDSIRQAPRAKVERDLVFAGFLVLDCPLKEDTTRTIRELVKSQHRVVVITGDNALTACHAAKQIGVHTRESLILQASESSVVWQGIDDGSAHTLPDNATATFDFDADQVASLRREHDLCVTGEALTAIHSSCAHMSSERQTLDQYMDTLRRICPHVSVFARTSPQQKEHILQALDRAGLTTAMCGDGTNDVGALKRAHVGVSIVNNPEAENSQRSLASQLGNSGMEQRLRALQEEEELAGPVKLGDASIASPFTSKSSSIRVVKQLVRQGRCTLVTTIQMYKILGVNCLVTAFYLSSLYMFGVKNGDQQLTIVGLGIAMFFLFLSHAKPAKRLSATRPPSGVFCWPVLLSIFGQFGIHLWILSSGLLMAEPFVDPNDPAMHPDGKFSPNVVNSIMFLLSAVMQVTTFVANYRGHPFMQSFWSHKLLSRSSIVAYVVLFLAVSEWAPWLNVMLELVPLPSSDVKQRLFFLMAGDAIVVFVWESFVTHLSS